PPAKEIEFEGLRVFRLPFAYSRPASILAARREIQRLEVGAELLHTMAMPALLPSALARTRNRIPWVHTEHYSALVSRAASLRSSLSLGAFKRLFRCPTETIAVSASLARVIDRYRRR